jgi:hypothetical protein
MAYRKTQIGWWPIAIFAIPLVLLLFDYFFQWRNRPLTTISLLLSISLLVLIVLLFYKLTVETAEDAIRLSYGIGLIRITLKIDEFLSANVVKTPWYYGLGIRITPKGMLYNIQGTKAVLLEYMHKGELKTVLIGSPEPEKLKRNLESQLRN